MPNLKIPSQAYSLATVPALQPNSCKQRNSAEITGELKDRDLLTKELTNHYYPLTFTAPSTYQDVTMPVSA